jgi:hypothetical protein
LLDSTLRARLQVEGVALHFLNDVFRLNLALEATESIVYGLTLLQPNFCQSHHPPTRSQPDTFQITPFVARSAEPIVKSHPISPEYFQSVPVLAEIVKESAEIGYS